MGLKVVGIGLMALIISACASPPRQRTPVAQQPAPVAQKAAAPAAAAATNPVAAPAANGNTPALTRAFLKAGYAATTYKGRLYYCRTEEVTGTQFKRRVCLTEAQMQEEQRKAQQMRDLMLEQRAGAPCIPMPQCAG